MVVVSLVQHRPATPTAPDFAEPTRDQAVELLFRRHYADLLRLAYCLLGERPPAEVTVQDAFRSLYRSWNRLEDRDAALDHLRSAVINRSRTRAGPSVRDRAGSSSQPAEVPLTRHEEDALAGTENDALRRAENERVPVAVRDLPWRQREVVVCRYYLDLDVAETATLLHVTSGSIRRHSHRALHTLSERLVVTPQTSIEHLTGDLLHAVADLDVTDQEVQEAGVLLRARLATDAERRRRSAFRTAATTVVLTIAVGVIWWLTDPGPEPPRPSPEAACRDAGRRPELPGLRTSPENFIQRGAGPGPVSRSACRLVLAFSAEQVAGGPGGRVWLYSDGRVISWGTSPASFSGYLERRLTRAGVQRVRSDAVARLGPPVRLFVARGFEVRGPLVHFAGQLFTVRDPARYARRLLDLSWLPQRMWQTTTARPYASTWYVTCYGGWRESVGRDRLLRLLPPTAAVVLRTKTPTARSGRPRVICAVLTAREKSTFVVALEDARADVTHSDNPRRYVLGPAGEPTVSVTFDVVLPGGASGLTVR